MALLLRDAGIAPGVPGGRMARLILPAGAILTVLIIGIDTLMVCVVCATAAWLRLAIRNVNIVNANILSILVFFLYTKLATSSAIIPVS